MEKGWIAVFQANDDVLHVLAEDLGGYPAQVTERPQVAAHEGLHGAALDELDVHGSREALHHDEG